MPMPESPLEGNKALHVDLVKQHMPELASADERERRVLALESDDGLELVLSVGAITDWIQNKARDCDEQASVLSRTPPQIYDDPETKITYAGEIGVVAGRRALLDEMKVDLIARIYPSNSEPHSAEGVAMRGDDVRE